MITLKGKVAFKGYALGDIVEWAKKDNSVRRTRIVAVEEEVSRFQKARKQAMEELQVIFEKAVVEVGEANAAIFEVHQMMLEDDDYIDSVVNIVRKQKVNAEYAVAVTGDNFSKMFSAMNDDYMKERAADVKDISERLIAILSNATMENKNLTAPCIIVADDLAPSETVQLNKDMVIAFVTRKGSVNSHTAILARTMNIPALVNVEIPNNIQGKRAIVDGEKGLFMIEPTEEMWVEYQKKKEKEKEKIELLLKYKGKEAITKSGKKIRMYANIGGVGDVGAVLQNDADGIGLFRSEFLYLEKDHYPTEEEQLKVYKTIAETMAGKPVIIRTLDIGADKQIDYFELEKEENPALGYRAIRICLERVDIFKEQLRAILRASAYGNISILIPMISSEWEIVKVKEILEQVKESLELLNIEFCNVELGVMIETPAAVMIADDLAKHVDFFSIGSNDLTQYTLAIDRQNSKLEPHFDAHHPAVLKMIKMVIESAHKYGIWAGICGELGADLELVEKFIEWGIDELSVSPSMVLGVKEKIIQSK